MPYAELAVADRNTLAGVVRAHVRLREIKREAPPPPPSPLRAANFHHVLGH